MSEDMIVRHCSPTLAGIKTGNLFTCCIESPEFLKKDIRQMNKRLCAKGIRILPLRITEHSALIYVYRPARLKNDLEQSEAAAILQEMGYSCAQQEKCIVNLVRRLREGQGFPHEIGLFLGYPPEDVRGFINQDECKCSGCWKVYGDEVKAQKLFSLYKKCTDAYLRLASDGKSIERLAVACR